MSWAGPCRGVLLGRGRQQTRFLNLVFWMCVCVSPTLREGLPTTLKFCLSGLNFPPNSVDEVIFKNLIKNVTRHYKEIELCLPRILALSPPFLLCSELFPGMSCSLWTTLNTELSAASSPRNDAQKHREQPRWQSCRSLREAWGRALNCTLTVKEHPLPPSSTRSAPAPC